MPDMDDLVAREQARVLGGGVHRFPEDNYSPLDLESVDVLFCARALAGQTELNLTKRSCVARSVAR